MSQSVRRLFDKGERVAAQSRNVICSSALPLRVALLVLLRVAHADDDDGFPSENLFPCLVELKTQAFSHENLGQLNTYVAYYKKHEMTAGDQPPVGILLCTRKNESLVEFALGDLPNKLFVSRYAVEMPKKAEMEAFLKQLGKQVPS
jgi:hypothetical protein